MSNTIAQNSLQNQPEAGNRKRRADKVKNLINRYEETIFAFFRELKVPVKYREVIRALIIASGGETIFEASYTNLTNLLYKRNGVDFWANKESVRNSVKGFLKWQEKKKIQLVRLIEIGRKRRLPEGGEEFFPSRYEMVLLDELAKVLHEGGRGMEQRIREAVSRLRNAYIPEEEKKKVSPYKSLKKWRNSSISLFKKSIRQAEALDMNPVEYGQIFLSDLSEILCDMEEEFIEKENRKRRLDAFLSGEYESADNFKNDSSVNAPAQSSYGWKGMEKHHANNGEIMGRNIPSYKRFPSPERGESSSTEYISQFINSSDFSKVDENRALKAALHYANLGIPVFPLQYPIFVDEKVRCSCRFWKKCGRAGKHPKSRHGSSDATTDAETLRDWWGGWPMANIGLLTGRRSNLFVLDVDPRSGGEVSLEELQDAYGELTPTLTAISGSGGRHLFFNYPDVKIHNSTSLIAPGLDIKSDGGYVVAAPSIHLSGGNYSWHGVNTPVLDAPNWLIALILLAEEDSKPQQSSGQKGQTNHPVLVATDSIVKCGERNDYLFAQARGLVNSFSAEEVRRRIQAKNLARCVPPLEEHEVEKIVRNAESYLQKNRFAA